MDHADNVIREMKEKEGNMADSLVDMLLWDRGPVTDIAVDNVEIPAEARRVFVAYLIGGPGNGENRTLRINAVHNFFAALLYLGNGIRELEWSEENADDVIPVNSTQSHTQDSSDEESESDSDHEVAPSYPKTPSPTRPNKLQRSKRASKRDHSFRPSSGGGNAITVPNFTLQATDAAPIISSTTSANPHAAPAGSPTPVEKQIQSTEQETKVAGERQEKAADMRGSTRKGDDVQPGPPTTLEGQMQTTEHEMRTAAGEHDKPSNKRESTRKGDERENPGPPLPLIHLNPQTPPQRSETSADDKSNGLHPNTRKRSIDTMRGANVDADIGSQENQMVVTIRPTVPDSLRKIFSGCSPVSAAHKKPDFDHWKDVFYDIIQKTKIPRQRYETCAKFLISIFSVDNVARLAHTISLLRRQYRVARLTIAPVKVSSVVCLRTGLVENTKSLMSNHQSRANGDYMYILTLLAFYGKMMTMDLNARTKDTSEYKQYEMWKTKTKTAQTAKTWINLAIISQLLEDEGYKVRQPQGGIFTFDNVQSSTGVNSFDHAKLGSSSTTTHIPVDTGSIDSDVLLLDEQSLAPDLQEKVKDYKRKLGHWTKQAGQINAVYHAFGMGVCMLLAETTYRTTVAALPADFRKSKVAFEFSRRCPEFLDACNRLEENFFIHHRRVSQPAHMIAAQKATLPMIRIELYTQNQIKSGLSNLREYFEPLEVSGVGSMTVQAQGATQSGSGARSGDAFGQGREDDDNDDDIDMDSEGVVGL